MGNLRSELKKIWNAKTPAAKGNKPTKPLGESQAKSAFQSRPLKWSAAMTGQQVIPAKLTQTSVPTKAVKVSGEETVVTTLVAQKLNANLDSNSKPPKVTRPVAPLPSPVPTSFTALPKNGLTRMGIYRDADDWVALGTSTQYRASEASRNMDVVIGIDFGTSYTKAAVGLNDKIFPVTWEGVSKGMPSYLLPSEYSKLPDGTTVFGQHPSASMTDVQTDLKLPFINLGISHASIARASVFLALVLRYVRAWVYRHHDGKIGSSKIRWQLNIGAPSNGLENDRLSAAYIRLAGSAWALSVNPTNLLFAEAQNMAPHWSEQQALKDMVSTPGVFPEFVAQMAGYMQSPQRVRGLHSLIDVGGGTLDIVTFNVHSVDDEDTFPFLVPDVRPLGTHGLLQNRFVDAHASPNHRLLDELAPLPNAGEFAANTNITLDHVNTRDNLFSKEIDKVVRIVFDTTRTRRYRLSDAWQTGVRTFFTGGGANVDLYKAAIRNARVSSAGGLLLMPLPPHPKLDGFDHGATEYQRISVACGLAQDSYTLGRIVPAKEVEDDRPVGLDAVDRPDRDELYAK